MTTTRVCAALLLAAVLVVAPGAFAADAFLKLEGVDGESTDDKHKGEIEVDTLQLNALHGEVQRASRGAGAGAGKITFNPFSITRKVDKSSPVLFQHCATGQHIPRAILSMRKAGGTQQEYLVVTLHDVTLSSYRTVGSGESKTESFLVNAASATIDYVPTPRAGAGGQNVALAPGALHAAIPLGITGATASAPFTGLAVTLTITSTGPCLNAFVDYGDGSISEGHALTGTSTTLPAHTYPTAGAKTIKVGGRDAPYWPQVPQKAPPQKGANPCTGWAPEVHVTLRSETAPATVFKPH